MREIANVDLGSIKIHKKLIAEIIQTTIKNIKGASLIDKDFTENISEMFGLKTFPGIMVNIDKNNQVSIEVKVNVKYGLRVLDIARQIQYAIRKTIEQTVDIDLGDINVNIHGIERGGQ